MMSAAVDWARYFTDRGHSTVALLGRGMDGVVYRLGDGLVGKVWRRRTEADLQLLRDFYDELAAQRLPFATPSIVALHDQDGTAISIERELPGTSLRDMIDTGRTTDETAQDAFVHVVTALDDTQAGPATRALPVLDETTALRHGDDTWRAAISALVTRRAATYHDALSQAIPDFDTTLHRVLANLPDTPGDQIVHGDICPENVLVDQHGHPTALLDWGFLTMAGDNAFDAATAAGFFDMYGPRARHHRAALLHRFGNENGTTAYLAAYAVLGANAYDAAGTDDHFAWCVNTLRYAT